MPVFDFDNLDVLADSAEAAVEAETAIRQGRPDRSRLDDESLRDRKKRRRRVVRRPKQKKQGENGFDFAWDGTPIPPFVPSDDLLQAQELLAAAESDAQEA